MTLEALKSEITKLPREQRAALVRWLEEQDEQAWDQQIRDDYRAGKLNELIERAEKEFDDGTIREAP
jgi:hypothetical protein